MLKFIIPELSYQEVYDGEKGLFLSIPKENYLQLKGDFQLATHLKSIDNINLYKSKGVIINSKSQVDAYIAAVYLYKKYIVDQFESTEAFESTFGVNLKQYKELSIDPDADFVCEGEGFDEIYDIFHLKWRTDHSYINLPIIEQSQYQFNSPDFHQGPFAVQYEYNKINNRYWEEFDLPLILQVDTGASTLLKDLLEKENKFVILINAAPFRDIMYSHFILDDDNEITPEWQKDLFFDLDYEIVEIEAPEQPYLEFVFKKMVSQEGYELSPDIAIKDLIEKLKKYRKNKFDSLFDLQKLIKKAIRYTNSKTLTSKDFFYFMSKNNEQKQTTNLSAYQELNSLIGLEEVKKTLLRTINKLQLAKKRQEAGYSTDSFHLGAVFMGNPGTAKTTVARIFGKLLFEMGVLSNNVFAEISRQDLVGKYVGWTAPKVVEVFEKNKGGTIFIDEAYSLFNSQDSFSAEACTVIIQQMENNPDTLVIFAGYTEEMKRFIKEANSGLQSRITNIIEFPDYSYQELLEIFHYQLAKSNFKVADVKQTNKIILNFLSKMSALPTEKSGNGRLMRKLFSSAVGFLAQRESENIDTLLLEDIQNACNEIYESEKFLHSYSSHKKIGFCI